MTLRFAVGHPTSLQSSSWKLWVHGDDAYLVQRGVGARHQKFSFHKSGNCRWARIEPGISGANRVILEWQREEVAPKGLGKGTLLLSIAFPTNHLSAPRASEQTPLRWIEPAPPGKAVIIEIFVTNENESSIKEMLSQGGERYVVYCKVLQSGFRICATSAQFDCGPVDINMPAAPAVPGVVFGEVSFPDEDASGIGRPIRGILMLGEDLPPTVWDLGGYEVAKVKM